MDCPVCTRPIPSGRAFCGACGAPVGSGAPTDDIDIVLRPRTRAAPPEGRPPIVPTGGLPSVPVGGSSPRIVIDVDDTAEILPPEPPTTRLPVPTVPGGGVPARRLPVGPPAPPEPPPPAAGEPWWSGRRGLYAAAGAFAVVAVVAVIATLALRGKNEQLQRAGEILQATQVDVTEAYAQASDAGKIRSINKAGRDARQAAIDLRAVTGEVKTIENEELQRAAQRQLSAERAYLDALSGLRMIGFKAAEDQGLPKWRSTKRALDLAARDIRTANAELVRLEVPGDVRVDVRALAATAQNLNGTLRTASRQLRTWRQQLRDYRQRRGEAQRNADAWDSSYASPIRSDLVVYDQDREKVDVFAQQVDDLPLLAASRRIDRFVADREKTIAALSSKRPSGDMAAAHEGLVAPVQTSLEGLQAAQEAIAQAFLDTSDDAKVTEQPAWSQFQEISAEVDGEISSSRSTWQGAVSSRRAQLANEGVGREPRRPNV